MDEIVLDGIPDYLEVGPQGTPASGDGQYHGNNDSGGSQSSEQDAEEFHATYFLPGMLMSCL